MERILVVVGNTIRGILHRRILYLWIAGMGLVALMALPGILLSFGNEAVRNVMRQQTVVSGLDTWSSLCIGLAIFMGATAIGYEKGAKTLTAVFARPIRRWEFLTGKWIGVQIFALLGLATGLVAAVVIGTYFGAEFDLKILGLAVALSAAAIAVYSALALALSTVTHSILAGALTILFAILPGFIVLLSESPNPVTHGAGVALDLVVPPGYSSHYEDVIHASIPFEAFMAGRGRIDRRRELPEFPSQRREPDIEYYREFGIFFQNIVYSIAFWALGCLVFSSRELR